MNAYAVMAAVPALLVLLVVVWFVVRALRAETDERDWVQGRATVLSARPSTHDRADAPQGSYLVQARLATADGRAVSGWAEGAYPRAYEWVGSTRPAWHHPAQIERFRLIEPRGALVGFLRLLPAVLLVAFVLAVFVVVGLLATR